MEATRLQKHASPAASAHGPGLACSDVANPDAANTGEKTVSRQERTRLNTRRQGVFDHGLQAASQALADHGAVRQPLSAISLQPSVRAIGQIPHGLTFGGLACGHAHPGPGPWQRNASMDPEA
jgi:hypothetical protein